MRTRLVAAMLVALGMVLEIVLATPASASTYGHQGDHDAYALTREMRDNSYTGTVDYARQLASVICARRAGGYSQDSMENCHVGLAWPSTIDS